MKKILVVALALIMMACSKGDPTPPIPESVPELTVVEPVIEPESIPEPPIVDEPVVEPEPIIPEPIIPDFIGMISWVAPTERECTGDPCIPASLSLSEISGYKIYWGTASGDYMYEAFTTEWEYILVGTGYAVATCLDTDGRESRYSKEIKY